MIITPGTRLGPYEVVSRIGAGGMGEVFRARDTRLDRNVAIKVLTAEFRGDARVKVRFAREARTISRLSHPHICTLYDVGDDYLVMELLEGETLATRIARGPLPLADVLKFGAQIADALERAHRAGIVHRDLKPENVMITKSGVKVLDFGLAKAIRQEAGSDIVTGRYDRSLTEEGMIVGTLQYMAPEQLKGEDADARTDLFALGAVLYEMATGRTAFEGTSRASIIAAITGKQPEPVSHLVPLSPSALDHVIQRCLEKQRDDRWQSAHDVAEELKWIASAPAERKARPTPRTIVAVAAILALALVAAAAMWLRPKNAPSARVAFAIAAPKGGHWFVATMLSPDGRTVAFTARNSKNEGGIFVRRVDQIESVRLTSSPDDVVAAWSPDSNWIAYLDDSSGTRQLKKIAPTGGTPELISSHVTDFGFSAAWSPDGTILFNPLQGEGLHAVHPDRPRPVPVTKLDAAKGEIMHTRPQFLSDGKRFLYTCRVTAGRKNEIWAGSLDGNLKKLILRADALIGVAKSRLYYYDDGRIYARSLDEDDLSLHGPAHKIVQQLQSGEAESNARATVAADGSVLYRPQTERTFELGWFDRQGRQTEAVFAEVNLRPMTLSHDGTRVAAQKWDGIKRGADIYVIDLQRRIRWPVTSDGANNVLPVWSPDDKTIYFMSDREGVSDIFAQAEDGATPPVTIWKSDRDKTLMDVSPDGQTLLASEVNPKSREDILLVPIAAPDKRRAIVATEAHEKGGEFSRDGSWIAYLSTRSGRGELYMRRVDGGPSVLISNIGITGYCWSRDGSEFYVRMPGGEWQVIPITYSAGTVVPGKATPLFPPSAIEPVIIAATEKGFLMRRIPDPSDHVFYLHYLSSPID